MITFTDRRWIMQRLAIVLLALMASVGCAGQHLWHLPDGGGVLVRECPSRLIPFTCDPQQCPCESVKWRPDPAGQEAWQFEARIQMRAPIGISYGRMPQDFVVIGTQAQCELARARIRDAGTPTEACQGPLRYTVERD